MSAAHTTKAQLLVALLDAEQENKRLTREIAAMHVAQRPSRTELRAERLGYVPTEAQREAHRIYREHLSLARELAIRTKKCVTVEGI